MEIPDGLGPAGRSLFQGLVDSLPDNVIFDSREVEILEQCARIADTIDLLDEVVREQGPTTVGSKGQPVLTSAIAECRLQRLALGRLLAQLELPNAQGVAENPLQKRARRAAESRWIKRDEIRRMKAS